jgi:hypothetical protein
MAEGIALESFDVRSQKFSRECRVFTKAIAVSGPSRFGGKIDLWMEGSSNTDSKIFLPRNLGKLAYQVGGPDSC